ncbi:CD59 glycoprotein [Osmerus mordax]|uniref:CD59 glycoprotein n=1 Tax=Osmerus mordax TaxID=8014 RepID=UPI00350ED48C
MRNSFGLCLAFCFAIFELGSAIRCYACQDYTGSCTKTQDCSLDDACLSLHVRGGDIIRRCIKNSECDFNQLSNAYPQVESFSYKCCTSNLCNGAVSISGGKPLLGLLVSLVGIWWCMH